MKEIIEKLLKVVDSGVVLVSSLEDNSLIIIDEDEIEKAKEIIRIGILFHESMEKEDERRRFLLIQELRKNQHALSENKRGEK